ncbi:metallophosphoesterase [Bacteroidales bacterium]|uniref:metallophosphoesterase n=1 Tax=Tenuifilum sp. TaxID=2760880 RepID=UPI001B5CCC32|nr:metallophosphoesterase [Bacteroidales bacterium]HQE55025.1 metallophosphoesterase [Tenuifilum sp.]HQG73554.1 metallophosphoesterase [Tenuifilum sp.]HQI89609.1 metallophosphoesterase [Tenuifilum sp.]HRR11609.1 metallophosphoesterase [Tenuifilum sp.]
MKSKFEVLVIGLALMLSLIGCKNNIKERDSFSIAFMTDIHLQPEDNAVEGFTKALDTVNKLNPDFIITGGDLIMDALGQSYNRADSLYNLYQQVIKKSSKPVYNTMGNHEIYGIYKKSNADPANPEYGEMMFEKRLGKSYYAFEHKGWKFMVMNSIEDTKRGKYIGQIDSTQIAWIKNELKTTNLKTPIVIITHIPFITAYTQKYGGSTLPNDSTLVVYNAKEVIDIFNGYNLKLVLQGHLHIVEDIYIDGIHFITGGAVSGGWWEGPYKGVEEGFLHITFGENDFRWSYVDYGWQVQKP